MTCPFLFPFPECQIDEVVNGNALELSCELLRNLITAGSPAVAFAFLRFMRTLAVARIGDSPFSFFFLSSFSLFFSLPFLFCPSVSSLIFFFLLPLI
ncbi:centromere protein X [Pyrus ussuriensis x Pyrus communis]|uniref:Centromere protein X n=1 Tax=Pyrus ussuriensis x Pyrus communis TaxID=2448454 RepID=A0A5N5G1J0_9ROSA|nr:centromere protein X [Pyrus ussuriensis x Pyrus communis]